MQKRLIKTIDPFFPCSEIPADNKKLEFVIRIIPFNEPFCSILIEKIKSIDTIRIVCVVFNTEKVKNVFQKATGEETTTMKNQFQNLYLKYKTECLFSKDYASIQNIRILLTQNTSLQKVLDIVSDDVLMVKEASQYLISIDGNIQSTDTGTDHSFFQ